MVKPQDGQPRSEKRRATETVQKRVTPAQKAAFEARARDQGYETGSAYLEAFILGREAIVRRDRKDLVKILAELGKQGSNLNQLAHAINSGKIQNLSADQMAIISSAHSAVTTCSENLRKRLL
jgi:hypothetical protein